MNTRRATWCVFFLLAAAGCGRGGESTEEVDGTVTFDGQPLPEGDVAFIATKPDEGSYGGKIVDGKFSFPSGLGAKRVEITAYREVPGQVVEDNPGQKTAVTEQYVPSEYNEESILTATVTDGGENHFDFPLKSAAK